MTAAETKSTVRVAVTQAEPEWLELDKSVEKTLRLIKEAAENGAKLVAFPECWITGYPAWIWSRPVDFALTAAYIKNSLKVNSPQMELIRACAEENKINVCFGFSENDNDSLYIAQATIGSDGEIKMLRRKLKPTHMERTIFGDASGKNCLKNVVDAPGVGRVGALACWEHIQPLLKYHTVLQKEDFHIAAWPPVSPHDGGPGLWSMTTDGVRALSQTYAIESQSFVLHTTALITQKGIDRMGTTGGPLMSTPGGGNSAIIGPDGRKLSEDIPETEERILYADVNLDDILHAKGFVDVGGHYSRPDMLWLGVDDKEKKHLRALEE
ncbi:aliphatic nitrilase protein [Rutstroemia sp. NJR-2017a WRK4]|nr:aliphatic nitrilase protein [Rutstroemia sp. NJR-2017a WRK4]